MDRAKMQLLRNPEIQPSSDVIGKALGEADLAYIEFINELEIRDIHLEWRYYNDGKSWLGKGIYRWKGPRGAQNEITVFWLSVWDGFFKVSIYVPEKDRAEVHSLSLNDEVKLMIENAKQMGKLKYFPLVFDLCTDEMFNSIFTLLEFRINSN